MARIGGGGLRGSIAAAVCGAWLAAPVPCLSGQAFRMQTTLDSGTLVRLHFDSGSVVAGRLLAPLAADSGTIRYCLYPRPRCTAMAGRNYAEASTASIRHIEVQRGTHAVRGAIIGAAVGAAALIVMSYAAGLGAKTPSEVGGVAQWTLGLAVGLAFPAGIGALFGSQSPRWGPAP